MKKFAFILFVSLLLSPVLAYADSCQSLVITGHPTYSPIAWAVKGKIVGAAPEMVADIAKDLGVKKVISKNFGTWAKAQKAAKVGEAELILAYTKTMSV